jgi:hypothetical protein
MFDYKCSLIITVLIFSSLPVTVKNQVVCSLDELIRELYEDLADNGKLDCLRKSVSPYESYETEDQRRMRKDAEWNSDCSFETDNNSPYHWLNKLKTNYGINSLVDVDGKEIDRDFEDQADMCEIVRALIAGGKIPEISNDVRNIDMKVLDFIDCPGADSQTQICAATAGSFAEKKGWLIMLEPLSITLNTSKEPKYVPAG